MKQSLALFALVVALLPLEAASQWVWTDKDGRKVFSDRAPSADVPDKNILKRPGQTTTRALPDSAALPGMVESPEKAASAARSAASAVKPAGIDKDLAERKKQADQAQAAERKSEEERVSKARADNCNRAKNTGFRCTHWAHQQPG